MRASVPTGGSSNAWMMLPSTASTTTTARVYTAARAARITLSGIEGLGFEPGKRRYDTTPAAGVTSTTVAMTPAGDAVLEGFAVTAGDSEVAAIGDDGAVAKSIHATGGARPRPITRTGTRRRAGRFPGLPQRQWAPRIPRLVPGERLDGVPVKP